jgi:hypothetical protein
MAAWVRKMDGLAPGGTYRTKITIRFKVRRSERFVEEEEPTKKFDGWVDSKKAGLLPIDFSFNKFSLDRRIIGYPPSRPMMFLEVFSRKQHFNRKSSI